MHFYWLAFFSFFFFFAVSSPCATPSLTSMPIMEKVKDVYYAVCKLRKDPVVDMGHGYPHGGRPWPIMGGGLAGRLKESE